MNKLNAYERQTETTLRQLQTVYLSMECGLSNKEIANITEYAIGTVRIYIRKYADQIDKARQFFCTVVVETPTEQVDSILYREFRDGRPAVAIELMAECGQNLKNEQAVYFFKFYENETLLFNKIGTTTKDIIARLRREIGDYSKNFNITKVEIHRMRSCGNVPAEGAESALRAEFIKRYPTAFRKNDRFFGVNISSADFDNVYSKYFG